MNDFITLTPEQQNARKRRNLMLALTIIGFVILIFFVSLARMSGAGAPQ